MYISVHEDDYIRGMYCAVLCGCRYKKMIDAEKIQCSHPRYLSRDFVSRDAIPCP